MSPEEERQRGLTRDRLVASALELINEEGLEGLSMRALADRLEVKAASLYWHVRDRRELLELLAESILEGVRLGPRSSSWRSAVLAAGAALRDAVARQKDAGRILLEVPDAVERSDVYAELRHRLEEAGLQSKEAREVGRLVMVEVITARAAGEPPPSTTGSQSEASIAIDSGSRGVVLRAGADMQSLVRAAHARTTPAPAIVRGDTVVVRRLRGVGLGEIELNSRHPWRFKIQGPTWNTILDVGGLDVREVKLDGGAAKVECFLPRPRGIVPIIVSGGAVGLKLHRPAGVAVAADVSSGAVKLKLDDLSVKAAVTDLQWESVNGGSVAPDRYQLRISGGAVQVELDSYVPTQEVISGPPARLQPAGEAASALEILLDGVASRINSRRTT
ncbi:MAG: TetR family transcriptional regulator [Candidatus Dormibacterales bacterium]